MFVLIRVANRETAPESRTCGESQQDYTTNESLGRERREKDKFNYNERENT